MTQMMETLESRQMFSVALAVEPTALPADTSAPPEVVVSEKVAASAPNLFKYCAGGKHLKEAMITA